MSKDPEDLRGGSTEVTKVGGRVLRARRQGSTNVEWLLTVLERRGFRYSPRFLGLSDDDRQVLEFIEGQAGAYPLLLTPYSVVCSAGYSDDATGPAIKSSFTTILEKGQEGLGELGFVPLPQTYADTLRSTIDAL